MKKKKGLGPADGDRRGAPRKYPASWMTDIKSLGENEYVEFIHGSDFKCNYASFRTYILNTAKALGMWVKVSTVPDDGVVRVWYLGNAADKPAGNRKPRTKEEPDASPKKQSAPKKTVKTKPKRQRATA